MDTLEHVDWETATQPNYAEKRRFPRTNVVWQGKFEAGGRSIECLVLNLSANGAKLQLSAALGEDDWAGVLSMPRIGRFQSKVAWCEPEHRRVVGLTFQEAPAHVAEALAKVMPNSQAARVPPSTDAPEEPGESQTETWYRLLD